mgnify:CR=1 FL=1
MAWKGGTGYGVKGPTPTVKTTEFGTTCKPCSGTLNGKSFTPTGAPIGHVKQFGYRGTEPENAAVPSGHKFRMTMAWNKHTAKKGMA